MARKTDMTGTTHPSAAPPPVPPPALVTAAGTSPPKSSPSVPPPATAEIPAARRRLRDDPRVPFLLSTILHTLLLIAMALFHWSAGPQGSSALLARQGEPTEVLSLQANQPTNDVTTTAEGGAFEQPIAITVISAAAAEVTPPALTPLQDSELAGSLMPPGPQSQSNTAAQPLRIARGGGLSGRTKQGRIELGRRFGATAESEQAVDDALQYLANHQRNDGSWSFNLELDPCNGRCRHSKKGNDTPTPATAATGLALLAFLGAGHTHHDDGPYSETVRRGIYYLRAAAGEAAAGYDFQQGSMYGHGIALMALSEALAMTTTEDRRDSDLVDLVSRGASFSCVAQHDNGSWGYVPGSPGDTTLTGWQVLSLLAAKRNDVTLQTHTLKHAKQFIASTSEDRSYWFGYQRPPGEPTTTAIGLTLMLYLGESLEYTPFYNAITKLADRGPTLDNIYHDYYGTLAMHHSRHHHWDRWNTKLRDHLVATQVRSGHEKGSWHFADKWGDIGGRLYTTAMCAMTLEVYYRYLPLYDTMQEFPLD